SLARLLQLSHLFSSPTRHPPDLPPFPTRRSSDLPGNVPVEDYLRACRAGEHGGADAFLDVLRGAGARPVEANTFLRAIRDARSAGRFGVGVDDGAGRWSRASSTVNWVDTAAGRYALRRKDGWVTVTPVDPQRLLGMAEELVGEVAPGRLCSHFQRMG